jgi:hypothetical protein
VTIFIPNLEIKTSVEDPDTDDFPENDDDHLFGAVQLGIQTSTPKKDSQHTDFFEDLDCSTPSSIFSNAKILDPVVLVPEAPFPVPEAPISQLQSEAPISQELLPLQ